MRRPPSLPFRPIRVFVFYSWTVGGRAHETVMVLLTEFYYQRTHQMWGGRLCPNGVF